MSQSIFIDIVMGYSHLCYKTIYINVTLDRLFRFIITYTVYCDEK